MYVGMKGGGTYGNGCASGKPAASRVKVVGDIGSGSSKLTYGLSYSGFLLGGRKRDCVTGLGGGGGERERVGSLMLCTSDLLGWLASFSLSESAGWIIMCTGKGGGVSIREVTT